MSRSRSRSLDAATRSRLRALVEPGSRDSRETQLAALELLDDEETLDAIRESDDDEELARWLEESFGAALERLARTDEALDVFVELLSLARSRIDWLAVVARVRRELEEETAS